MGVLGHAAFDLEGIPLAIAAVLVIAIAIAAYPWISR